MRFESTVRATHDDAMCIWVDRVNAGVSFESELAQITTATKITDEQNPWFDLRHRQHATRCEPHVQTRYGASQRQLTCTQRDDDELSVGPLRDEKDCELPIARDRATRYGSRGRELDPNTRWQGQSHPGDRDVAPSREWHGHTDARDLGAGDAPEIIEECDWR